MSQASKTSPASKLNLDIRLRIVSFLDLAGSMRLRLVSREWCEAVNKRIQNLTRITFHNYRSETVARILSESLPNIRRVLLTGCSLTRHEQQFPKLDAISFVRCEGPEFEMRTVEHCQKVEFFDCNTPLLWKDAGKKLTTLKLIRHRPELNDKQFVSLPPSVQDLHLVRSSKLTTDVVKKKLPRGIKRVIFHECDEIELTDGQLKGRYQFLEQTNLPPSKTQIVEFLLKEQVMEQPEAIRAATKMIFAIDGLRDQSHPPLLCFAGPTGVGKTELAKTIAAITGRKLLFVSMGTFVGKDAIARFTGPSPGCVGYKDGKSIAKELIKHPNAVLLLDEFDLADKSVHNSLRRLLDDGVMECTDGPDAKLDGALIILTTNLGDEDLKTIDWSQPNKAKDKAMECVDKAIKEHFPEPIVGRLTGSIVPFRWLNVDALETMLRAKITQFLNKLTLKTGHPFWISDDSILELAMHASGGMGFRQAWLKFTKLLASDLNFMLADKTLTKGEMVRLAFTDDGFKLTPVGNDLPDEEVGYFSQSPIIGERLIELLQAKAPSKIKMAISKLGSTEHAQTFGTKVGPFIRTIAAKFNVPVAVTDLGEKLSSQLVALANKPEAWDAFADKVEQEVQKQIDQGIIRHNLKMTDTSKVFVIPQAPRIPERLVGFWPQLEQEKPSQRRLLNRALRGDPEACFALGKRAETVGSGSPKLAQYWYRRAADAGHIGAKKCLKQLGSLILGPGSSLNLLVGSRNATISSLDIVSGFIGNIATAETLAGLLPANLQSIGFENCYALNDQQFEPLAKELAKRDNLNVIDLTGCRKLTDASLALLSLKRLHSINLSDCKFTDFSPFAEGLSEELRVLTMKRCRGLTDEGLKALGSNVLSDLVELDLSYCDKVTGEGLIQLQELKLEALQKFAFVRVITRDDQNTEDAFLSLANALPIALPELDLAENSGLTNAGLKHVLTRVSHLTALSLRHCKELTEQGLLYLADYCDQLVTLNLCECPELNQKSLIEVVQKSVKTLRSLSIGSCPGLDGDAFCTLAKVLPEELTNLDVSNNPGLDDKAFCRLLKALPNLCYLNVRNCEKLTHDGLSFLADHLPAHLVELNTSAHYFQGHPDLKNKLESYLPQSTDKPS